MGKIKATLAQWPVDAEDTLTFGGVLAVGIGSGHRWGWDVGLIVFGAVLLFLALTPIRKVIDGRTN